MTLETLPSVGIIGISPGGTAVGMGIECQREVPGTEDPQIRVRLGSLNT